MTFKGPKNPKGPKDSGEDSGETSGENSGEVTTTVAPGPTLAPGVRNYFVSF